MADIDSLLKELEDEKKIVEKKPLTTKQKSAYAGVGATVIIIVLGLFLFVKSNAERQAEAERRAEIEATKQRIAKQKAETTEETTQSDYLLDEETFNSNVKILTGGNIGLQKDKENGLVGKMTLKDGSTITITGYTRRDGVMHGVDDKGAVVAYNDTWVRTLIAKLKAIQNQKQATSNTETTTETANVTE